MEYRVLLVEDEEELVSKFKDLCGMLKFDVYLKVTDHGNDALKLINSYRPHIVFMDTEFEAGPGYGVWEEVPGDIKDSTAIVGMSSDSAFRFGFQQNGADYFINKEFLSVPLLERIIATFQDSYRWE